MWMYILPSGWQDRLVPLDTAATEPGRGLCLDPHDCVVAKLLAGREKDLSFPPPCCAQV